jgi:hypothetical protein
MKPAAISYTSPVPAHAIICSSPASPPHPNSLPTCAWHRRKKYKRPPKPLIPQSTQSSPYNGKLIELIAILTTLSIHCKGAWTTLDILTVPSAATARSASPNPNPPATAAFYRLVQQ